MIKSKIYYKLVLITFFLTGLLSVNNTSAQAVINAPSDYIAIDELDNLYAVNGAELIKYQLDGKVLARYSNAIFGRISSIDVSDPLRILLFYREDNSLQYLNKQLSPLSDAINLYDLSDNEQALACNWNQGGFWVYTPLTQTLSYFDSQRQQVHQSENLSEWLNGAEPLALYGFNNETQLVLSNDEVLCFDAFGNFLRRHHVKIKNGFFANSLVWQYFNGSKIVSYTILNKTEFELGLEIMPETKSALICKEFLIQQNETSISIAPYEY